MGKPMVQVPDDTSVSIASLSAEPAIFRTKAGFLVSDFGEERFLENKFQQVEGYLEQDPTLSIIWVLQKAILDYWAADSIRIAELLRRFYRVQALRAAKGGAGKEMQSVWMVGAGMMSEMWQPNPKTEHRRVADLVVVSDVGAATRQLMTLLSWMGISSHTPREEGPEYFVEVIRPEKIIVGLSGSEMVSASPEPVLSQLYRERDRLKKSGGAADRLGDLERAEMEMIDKAKNATTSLGQKLLNAVRPEHSAPLLSTAMRDLTREKLPSFIKLFSRSDLGIKAPGPGREVFMTNSKDGQPRLLVCADPPLFDIRYADEGFNGVITGEDAYNVVANHQDCAGVLINSALSDTSVILDRRDLLRLWDKA